jgi:hypothetical protein
VPSRAGRGFNPYFPDVTVVDAHLGERHDRKEDAEDILPETLSAASHSHTARQTNQLAPTAGSRICQSLTCSAFACEIAASRNSHRAGAEISGVAAPSSRGHRLSSFAE